jgi:hypothetical protein
MQTLSYGYKQPEDGDTGSTFFPALNDNIQQLNDHNHDGVTSAPIPSSAIASGTVSLLSANWAADGTGRYKQTVTVPTGFSYVNNVIQIKNAADDQIIFPTIEKVTATTFRVYVCDNTLNLTAVFR